MLHRLGIPSGYENTLTQIVLIDYFREGRRIERRIQEHIEEIQQSITTNYSDMPKTKGSSRDNQIEKVIIQTEDLKYNLREVTLQNDIVERIFKKHSPELMQKLKSAILKEKICEESASEIVNLFLEIKETIYNEVPKALGEA
ncbi:hypothetical protein SYNTR_0708 [Candidatus Syntrophocurvum alkaliphilum]|uniref:Uncharacterized protein n=1 Tax=Candidatus Syntrophocurvum alkaliphilum TaxID=2293317 RepID=A0A6I6DIE1_9FIRM|nr:hypothetical protein [Candidatus Syntrophocurvum alkaliphilum]QGT99301.1 hypothetical protein SYNTR_0708 [Candidatus Syntrophocurvum alkaliphilum]